MNKELEQTLINFGWSKGVPKKHILECSRYPSFPGNDYFQLRCVHGFNTFTDFCLIFGSHNSAELVWYAEGSWHIGGGSDGEFLFTSPDDVEALMRLKKINLCLS